MLAMHKLTNLMMIRNLEKSLGFCLCWFSLSIFAHVRLNVKFSSGASNHALCVEMFFSLHQSLVQAQRKLHTHTSMDIFLFTAVLV